MELCSFEGYELKIHSMKYPLYTDGTIALFMELCGFEGYELKICSMNHPLYTDGTRALIGEERASFSQPQTP